MPPILPAQHLPPLQRDLGPVDRPHVPGARRADGARRHHVPALQRRARLPGARARRAEEPAGRLRGRVAGGHGLRDVYAAAERERWRGAGRGGRADWGCGLHVHECAAAAGVYECGGEEEYD